MNQKSVLGIAVAAVMAAALVAAAFGQTAVAKEADDKTRIRGELTAPSGGNPFGGDAIGTFKIKTDGHATRISAQVEIEPADGMVLEGWLVDAATDYKLSLGQLRGDSLNFRQNMVNPFTYNVIVITEEPVGDTDPNPATPVGGALLPSPFGM